MPTSAPPSGYAAVSGINHYYEMRGAGAPLVLLHGGLMAIGPLGDLLPALAAPGEQGWRTAAPGRRLVG